MTTTPEQSSADDYLKTLSAGFQWRAKRLHWPVTTDVGEGLSGVIACETQVGWVDAANGRLYYRGKPIEEVAQGAVFEETAFLLLEGEAAPEAAPGRYSKFRENLRAARKLPEAVAGLLGDLPHDTHPTRLLRAGVSAVGCFAMAPGEELTGSRHWSDLQILSQVAELTALAARHQRRLGYCPTAPEASLSEGLLTALLDRPPTARQTASLDLVLTLYADHGLDAPTFTSLVVGSCHADPYYNIVAGLSALRGPLLGGAGEAVLRQLLALRDENVARAWARGMAQRGWRIPGFGHRLYRRPDPRVKILREAARALAEASGQDRLLRVAEAAAEEAESALGRKGIYPNINFYAAVIFHQLGATPEMVPCLYAVGRMAGMLARVKEALPTSRIFRPVERYSGVGGRGWKAVHER